MSEVRITAFEMWSTGVSSVAVFAIEEVRGISWKAGEKRSTISEAKNPWVSVELKSGYTMLFSGYGWDCRDDGQDGVAKRLYGQLTALLDVPSDGVHKLDATPLELSTAWNR